MRFSNPARRAKAEFVEAHTHIPPFAPLHLCVKNLAAHAPASPQRYRVNRRVSSSKLAGKISAVTPLIISIVAFRLTTSAITP